jgi:hypothetical protein
MSLFDEPTARSSDPQTSRDAAKAVRPKVSSHRQRAEELLDRAGSMGLTDFELANKTGIIQTSIGVRRGELTKKGVVVPRLDDFGNPVTRLSPTGNPSQVWMLAEHVPAARRDRGAA